MVLNPFFQQGSTNEQNLVQSLINEQLQIYGVNVHYMPRKYANSNTIIKEVIESKFDDAYPIEAYVESFDGYGENPTLLSKFGIQATNELTLTISRDRFETYISPLMKNESDVRISTRPNEGDLVYFPYGRRLFEIKLVEHEKPFYQLGKGYTYELQCELLEYEDEILDTSIDEVDTTIQNEGYITTLELVKISNRAEVDVNLGTGYIGELTLLNEGSGFTSPPEIKITPPEVGDDPNVVALISSPNNNVDSSSISNLLVFSGGSGYKENPSVQIIGTGRGAVIRAGVNTESLGIVDFTITNEGAGYPEDAPIIVYDNENNIVGEGLALTDGKKIVKTIVTSAGRDLLIDDVKAIVSAPAIEGEGNYIYNEIVVGKTSGTKARVRAWDEPTKELAITNLNPEETDVFFQPGEIIEGETSGARFAVRLYDESNPRDPYAQNDEFEEEAKNIVDDTEYNQFDPFGEF